MGKLLMPNKINRRLPGGHLPLPIFLHLAGLVVCCLVPVCGLPRRADGLYRLSRLPDLKRLCRRANQHPLNHSRHVPSPLERLGRVSRLSRHKRRRA